MIAGLIVFFGGSAATWFLGLLASARAPVWWYIVGIGAVAVLATAIYPPWRSVTWGNIAKWRPLTTVTRIERVRAQAREEAEAAIAAERARFKPSIRAQWVIQKRSEDLDDHDWTIKNVARGSTAADVSLDVPREFMRVRSALDWPQIGPGERKQFSGELLDTYYYDEVDFVVAWTNEHDQRLKMTVHWVAS
ncbi:hypothetical protein [Microbacterium sp. TNHR37B]|uniref:hypothetical protein n=1 Tax=Microbacterium sp. TNHR37B TaxID=1775956 RepID=UPI0007B297B8|nr:hypothetical protein [Microbacterium sp. TNHR37B]KZE89100.1 hypothetical protein AVP41_01891 [Microbacterium sp. TNHR37B]